MKKIPITKFTLKSVPIRTRKKKLKGKWTCELNQIMEYWRSDKNGIMRRYEPDKPV